jgi:hypothetical protein
MQRSASPDVILDEPNAFGVSSNNKVCRRGMVTGLFQ